MAACKPSVRTNRVRVGRLIGRLYALVFVIAAVLAVVGQQIPPAAKPAGNQQSPVQVVGPEVGQHRIGEPPILRMNVPPQLADGLGTNGALVHVIVDPHGRLISADAGNSLPPDVRSQVEAAVRRLKYRPFERDGHTVWVKFEEYIPVAPPELQPSRHVAFPPVHDWKSVRITLIRTECYGMCPSYRVEIHGDGTVFYYGAAFVAIKGEHRGSIPREKVVELVNAFRAADYYSLRDEYVWPVSDCPTYETSIEIDGQLKKIKDYEGLQVGMPTAVHNLENDIDRLANTEQWTSLRKGGMGVWPYP